jgi:hypothetical protein
MRSLFASASRGIPPTLVGGLGALLLVSVILTSCGPAGPGLGKAFSFGEQVLAERARVEPQLVACDGNVHAGWIQGSEEGQGRGVYVVSSQDGGLTWNEPVRMDEVAGEATNSYLRLACRGGKAYAVWWGRTLEEVAYGQKRTLVRRSDDGGRTWERAVPVDRAATGFIPSVALDGEGGVYVAWNDERTGPHTIWFNASQDHGATWGGQDVRLDKSGKERPGQSANALEVQLAAATGGRVYAVWQDKVTGMALPHFRVSKDGGQNWGEEKVLSDDYGRFAWPPLITADDSGRVYVAWSGQRDEERGLYVAASNDGGRTWPAENRRIDGGAGARMLRLRSIASDEQGRLWVAWREVREGEADIWFNNSEDGGLRWGEAMRLSTTSPGDYEAGLPVVATDGAGGVAVAWAEDTDMGQDVYLRWSADGGTNWVEEPVALCEPPVNLDRSYPTVVGLGPGSYGVLWGESPRTEDAFRLRFRRVDVPRDETSGD